MSDKPVSSPPSPPRRVSRSRVSSGVPWWAWGLLVVVGGGIALSLVARSFREDPEVLYNQALQAVTVRDVPTIEQRIKQLEDYPGYESHRILLEGVTMIGSGRPLKAIPLLQKASEDPKLRATALQFLGNSFAQAEQVEDAIAAYETALREDPDANDSRRNLAMILVDLLAWDEALTHLNYMIDAKHRLGVAHKLRGDIRFDRGQFAEAAEDYETAIKEDLNDPANAMKADRLVESLCRAGNPEKAGEFIGLVDRPNAGAMLAMEKAFAEGKDTDVLNAARRIRTDAPNDVRMNVVYGRTMLRANSEEQAKEALAIIRKVIKLHARNRELYEVLVDLAKAAGENELAGLAQQNIDQLTELENEFHETFTAVTAERLNYETRAKLVRLAVDTGRVEIATKVSDCLLRYFPARESESRVLRQEIFSYQPQLVSTGSEPIPVMQPEGLPSVSRDSPPPLIDPEKTPLPETSAPN